MYTNLIVGIVIILGVAGAYIYYALKGEKKKVTVAAKKSVQVFVQNSIRLFSIFVIIALLQTFLSPEAVSSFLLKFNGIMGVLVGALTGSVMMGPAASSYPIAKYLLTNGAAVSLTAPFLFTWVAIGVVSFPLEMKNLGKRFTLLRNGFAFASAILVALLMGILV